MDGIFNLISIKVLSLGNNCVKSENNNIQLVPDNINKLNLL